MYVIVICTYHTYGRDQSTTPWYISDIALQCVVYN